MQNRTMQTSLYDYYAKTFECIPADTAELRDNCYHLRYHVYCLENPFEPKNEKEIETDEYDDLSAHFLLRHKPSGLFVGTTRIIAPHTVKQDVSLPPPVFQICEKHGISLPPEYKPETCFEVSRFAISKTFRRRTEDAQYPAAYDLADLEQDKSRIIPCMTLGLIAAIYQQATINNSEYCCAVMAPALARLLTKLGIMFTPAGPEIEYHGTRQIFVHTRTEFSRAVSQLRPDIMDIFTDGGKYPSGA